MSSRNLSILGLIAVLALVAGVWLANRQATTPTVESAGLYPQLKDQLDSVTAVRIVKAGGTPAVELKRGDGGWTVSERNGYPADEAKLRKLLSNIAEAKLLEEKTSNPDNYPALGVEDISKPDASGMQVELEGTKTPVKLIVGKYASGASSHYVRRADEPTSWLINKSLDTSSTADQWLHRTIIDVSADRVQSAEVKIGNAKPYTALKHSRADADFAVEGLPKGKELSSPSAAYNFASALSNLTLSDVKPASELTDKPSAQTTFKTFDGLVVEATGWKQDDRHYIALRTSYDAAHAEKFKIATADTEKKDGGEQAAADLKDEAQQDGDKKDEGKKDTSTDSADAKQAKVETRNVEEEASKTNALVSGWVYEIPGYKYDSIFKPLDELIKK
jgi:hypothetical protein